MDTERAGRGRGGTYRIGGNEPERDARCAPVVWLRVVRHPCGENGRERVCPRDGKKEGAVCDMISLRAWMYDELAIREFNEIQGKH